MTARTTQLLEIVANESLRRASRWLKESGLELAVHKTEAVLIIDRREFKTPKTNVGWPESDLAEIHQVSWSADRQQATVYATR